MARIFHVSGAINHGSPGRILEQICLLAQKHGYDSFIAHSSRNVSESQIPHYAVTNKRQEIIHALGAKYLDLHGLLSTKQTKELVRRIKTYKPDIIHLHNIHGYFCNFKVLFEYLDTVDIPVVWTLHDFWPITGRCFHFIGAECYKWKTGCFDCEAEKGYTVSEFLDRSKSLYKLKKRLFSSVKNMTLVPVSDWQASFLKDSFLKDCKIHTIHNGVDIEKFKPVDGNRIRVKHNLGNRFVIIGVASPWNTRKGLDDFCKLRSLLTDDFAIVMVGLKPEQINKLPTGIIGITRTENQQELAEYYSMADAFVNLTYLDTFPTVNLEALACGTPVLTYNTGGSPEAVDDKTGIVVEQGNIQAVVDAIYSLKNEPLSVQMCRQRAEELFDKDKCFEKYIDLYNSLLG